MTSNSKGGVIASTEKAGIWEGYDRSIVLSEDEQANQAADCAERIRDAVNSYHGEDRLRCAGFIQLTDQHVQILFEDVRVDSARMFIKWTTAIDEAVVIDTIINNTEQTHE